MCRVGHAHLLQVISAYVVQQLFDGDDRILREQCGVLRQSDGCEEALQRAGVRLVRGRRQAALGEVGARNLQTVDSTKSKLEAKSLK